MKRRSLLSNKQVDTKVANPWQTLPAQLNCVDPVTKTAIAAPQATDQCEFAQILCLGSQSAMEDCAHSVQMCPSSHPAIHAILMMHRQVLGIVILSSTREDNVIIAAVPCNGPFKAPELEMPPPNWNPLACIDPQATGTVPSLDSRSKKESNSCGVDDDYLQTSNWVKLCDDPTPGSEPTPDATSLATTTSRVAGCRRRWQTSASSSSS